MRSKACKCGSTFPRSVMINGECYVCVLQKYPPKTRRHISKYKKAVALRMSLATPLTVKQGLEVVNIVGLGELGYLQKVVEGKIVDHMPCATFYQRLVDELGGFQNEENRPS